MYNIISLQGIIGTDKRNPQFTLAKDVEKNDIHVFYGMALFDVVKNDKTDLGFKLMIGQMVNANLNQTVLSKEFGIAVSTMKRWAKAIKCSDPETLIKMLSGPGAPKKITTEIKNFIKIRFPEIYKENKYSYSKDIRMEIFEIFNKKISSETIRPLLNELKPESNPTEVIRANICESNNTVDNNQENIYDDNNKKNDTEESNNRKYSLECQNEYIHYCHHIGFLIFNNLLNLVSNKLQFGKQIILQWLVTILLGAKNIEQTKLMDFNSLETILGDLISTPHYQREKLKEFSESGILDIIIDINGQLVNIENETDFYYDPHTKHYTGKKHILKGWCSNIRMADKALHMDFIHTSSGEPVYIDHDDNFYDLRERFPINIKIFRKKVGIKDGVILTLVVDRGIYSIDLFNKIIVDIELHIITWEKGFVRGKNTIEESPYIFVLLKKRNNSRDFKKYEFKYIEKTFDKNHKMKQIIVLATNPNGNSIEVSILTDDFKRDPEEIISLMFQRWIQENDFKYLEKHFGINQITSYQSNHYKDIKLKIEDKEVNSGEYKALEKQIKNLNNKLKSALLQQHSSSKRNQELEEKIKNMTKTKKQLKERKKEKKEKMSKLELFIEQDFEKLQTKNKLLMDYLKILARNIFYLTLAPFKEEYDNYRDDHVIFRNLTNASGMIITKNQHLEILLYPTANYSPKTRKIIEVILEFYNSKSSITVGEKKVPFTLKLPDYSSKLFAIYKT